MFQYPLSLILINHVGIGFLWKPDMLGTLGFEKAISLVLVFSLYVLWVSLYNTMSFLVGGEFLTEARVMIDGMVSDRMMQGPKAENSRGIYT